MERCGCGDLPSWLYGDITSGRHLWFVLSSPQIQDCAPPPHRAIESASYTPYRYPWVKSTVTRFSSKLYWLDSKIEHRKSGTSNNIRNLHFIWCTQHNIYINSDAQTIYIDDLFPSEVNLLEGQQIFIYMKYHPGALAQDITHKTHNTVRL